MTNATCEQKHSFERVHDGSPIVQVYSNPASVPGRKTPVHPSRFKCVHRDLFDLSRSLVGAPNFARDVSKSVQAPAAPTPRSHRHRFRRSASRHISPEPAIPRIEMTSARDQRRGTRAHTHRPKEAHTSKSSTLWPDPFQTRARACARIPPAHLAFSLSLTLHSESVPARPPLRLVFGSRASLPHTTSPSVSSTRSPPPSTSRPSVAVLPLPSLATQPLASTAPYIRAAGRRRGPLPVQPSRRPLIKPVGGSREIEGALPL